MASSLVRLIEALGECAVEVTAGSIRVAGDVVTEFAAGCVEPCDRLLSDRNDRDDRDGRRREFRIGDTLERAVSGISDVAERSQKAFAKGLERDERGEGGDGDGGGTRRAPTKKS